MSKIEIIGVGTVGEATGKGFLHHGHTVSFCDKNSRIREQLKKEFLFVTKEPIDADIYFVCTHEDSVSSVIESLADKSGLIVIRSTVKPGITERLMEDTGRHICHNPEFLRDKYALDDFLYPRRIVIGECCKEHGDMLERLYENFKAPIVRTTPITSELAKFASNCYLACAISYWNEIDSIVKTFNGSPEVVRKIAMLDKRIPHYGARYSGKYSGKCLPKDLSNLISSAKHKGLMIEILRAIETVNDRAGCIR